MNIQYISDNEGKTTGVFIPIAAWNDLKNKYKHIEQENIKIPQWHIDEIDNRIAEYEKNPETALSFNDVMKEIKENL